MMYGYPEKWLEGMTTGEGIAAESRLGIVNGHIAERRYSLKIKWQSNLM